MSDHLSLLRRKAAPPESGDPSGRPSPQKTLLQRVAGWLPALLLLGFLLLAWLLFGDRFERGRPVEVVKVVTLRPAVGEAPAQADAGTGAINYSGSALFQASGWIESDPLPLRVTALYGGVVDEVFVLEGEAVEAGQLIARMITEDAELDRAAARARLAAAEAGLEQSRARREAARQALATAEREVRAAEAREAELKDAADRLREAGTAVFRESDITQAGLQLATQQRRIEALQARVDELASLQEAARAEVAVSTAQLEEARAGMDRAELALARTAVRSPMAGRIQELYAAPGMKRMLAMDGLDSATIAKIYRPEALQARIDVPLEEAARLFIDQPVRLRVGLLPDRNFRGVVTRILGQADIQRNTLQVKVRLLDPDPALRPEMLCRAEFLATARGGDSRGGQSASLERAAVYVPAAALVGERSERFVWAVGPDGRSLERRAVTLAPESRNGHFRVLEGLRPGELVVLRPAADLRAGERVRPMRQQSGETTTEN